MSAIEELDVELDKLDVEYKKLQEQKAATEIAIRDIRGRMTDIVKNKELIALLEARNIDTSNVKVIEGKLEQVASGPSIGGN